MTITLDENHIYRIEEQQVISVTQLLQAEGFIDYSAVPEERLEKAKNFGTAVHLMTSLYDKDDLLEEKLDENLRPYLNAWIKFRKDAGVGFDILEIENKIGSKIFKIAGTPDRIVMFNGKRTVLEIKSTASLQPQIELQTAGYMLIYNKMAEEGSLGANFRVKERLGILLKPDGTYKLENYDDKSDLAVFQSALNCHNWKKENLKNAKHN